MTETVSTGDTVFDQALDGGIPAGSAVLFTGGPGTGKTTGAIEFLQAGLDNGEQCLFISTEQSIADLKEAFKRFEFDLDSPNLTMTSIHASHGDSNTLGGEEFVMRTLDGGSMLDDGKSVPYTPHYIQQYFRQLGPADRVVLDSASGLAAVTDNHSLYRRVMIDIVRLFKQEFNATSILTAQEYANQDDTATDHGTLNSSLALQFTADGVVRLWQDEVEGEYHRYIHIAKMRGVNHDLRPYEMALTNEGLRLKPRYRSPPAELSAKGRTPSGLPVLDDLLGGGFITGGTVAYLYSGDAHAELFLSKVITEMVDSERDVVIVPPPNLTYEQFNQYLKSLKDRSFDSYLEEKSIRVLDLLSTGTKSTEFLPRGADSPAVRSHKGGEIFDELRQIQYNASNPVTILISCQTTQLARGEPILPQLISDLTAQVRGTDDSVIFAGTPDLIDTRETAQLLNASEQVLNHDRRPNGIETIRLKKGLGGEVGSSLVVEYRRERPYMSLS